MCYTLQVATEEGKNRPLCRHEDNVTSEEEKVHQEQKTKQDKQAAEKAAKAAEKAAKKTTQKRRTSKKKNAPSQEPAEVVDVQTVNDMEEYLRKKDGVQRSIR